MRARPAVDMKHTRPQTFERAGTEQLMNPSFDAGRLHRRFIGFARIHRRNEPPMLWLGNDPPPVPHAEAARAKAMAAGLCHLAAECRPTTSVSDTFSLEAPTPAPPESHCELHRFPLDTARDKP